MSFESFLAKVCRRCYQRKSSPEEAQACWAEHVRPEYQKMIDEKAQITHEQWQGMRANSYELREFMPLLDDDALVKVALYYKSQCSQEVRSYDGALVNLLTPLLCERIKGWLDAGKAAMDIIEEMHMAERIGHRDYAALSGILHGESK